MAKTQMSDLQDDTDNNPEGFPELKGVSILTETKSPVPDVATDAFLRPFEAGSFASPDTYKVFEKALESADKSAKSKQHVEGDQLSMYDTLDVIEPPYNQHYLAALYEKNGIHAGAVDAKIDNIVGLGYYWGYTRKADKIRDRAARHEDEDKKRKVDENLTDDKHKLDGMIAAMNSLDEFDETLEKILRDRFTTGNGYLEVGRRRDGTIAYLGHVPSANMRVRRLRDGFVQYGGTQPIFFRNFGDRTTADPFGNDPRPNEIIHYKKHSPTNTYYGVPEIVASVNNIAGIEFANQYNIEYFENKAVPRYIITTSGCVINQKTHAELLRFFETTTKGKHHRSILVPLPNATAKVEFHPVETKKQEASFIEYIDQNTSHILARHRVPANRLGITSGKGIGDARDANKMFKETVCNPEQRLIEKKLNRIFREITDLFSFKLSEYTLTDENEQSQIDERNLRNGIIVPDEAREGQGLPARPDGDGDQPLDVRSLQQLAQQFSEKQQKTQIAAQTKQNNANMAANAKVDAKQAKELPVQVGGAAGKEISQRRSNANQNRTKNANERSNKTDGVGATQSRNSAGQGPKPR